MAKSLPANVWPPTWAAGRPGSEPGRWGWCYDGPFWPWTWGWRLPSAVSCSPPPPSPSWCPRWWRCRYRRARWSEKRLVCFISVTNYLLVFLNALTFFRRLVDNGRSGSNVFIVDEQNVAFIHSFIISFRSFVLKKSLLALSYNLWTASE